MLGAGAMLTDLLYLEPMFSVFSGIAGAFRSNEIVGIRHRCNCWLGHGHARLLGRVVSVRRFDSSGERQSVRHAPASRQPVFYRLVCICGCGPGNRRLAWVCMGAKPGKKKAERGLRCARPCPATDSAWRWSMSGASGRAR